MHAAAAVVADKVTWALTGQLLGMGWPTLVDRSRTPHSPTSGYLRPLSAHG